ncbi:P-loop containing nucleoside triphosphate hydrolase protein [Xylaria cf. heliscus]|nr:P-loop containing nucleoside triphosphate hydrolase protein [Xylaria cf. heliscus]
MAGGDSIVGKKRKSDGRASSAKLGQNKRRNLGLKKLNARKAEINNQLGNMSGLASWEQDQSPDTTEYTPEQLKRDKAQLDDAFLVLKSKIERKGHEQGSPNELFQVMGMPTTIRDYQVVGVAFMLRQERSRKAKSTSKPDEIVDISTDKTEKSQSSCRGGILADDMGIGKTVQAIACMLAHPPSKKANHAHEGTTLIIVPNQGLIKQWTEELSRHGGVCKKTICKYGGGMGALGIQLYPYVLATYSQAERDFRLHFSKREGDEGPLFEVNFYRIILDEGDNIKNYNGSTSKACCELRAKLKWVLSGTPLRNNLKECLPYFRFLKIDVHEEQEEFEKKWKKPESDDFYDRTMQILANIMLRREAGHLFLGRQMCKLPDSHVENRILPITDEEAAISKHMEQAMSRREKEARQRAKEAKQRAEEEASQEPRKEAPDSGAPKSDASKFNYRVRCTRLRQAVDHPFLLETCIRDSLNNDELKDLIEELDKITLSKPNVGKKGPSAQPGEPSIYELAIDIKSHLSGILSFYNNDGCLECFSMDELQQLDCGHVMCSNCYWNHIGDVFTGNKKQFKCPQCGQMIAILKQAPNNKRIVQEEMVKIKSELTGIPDGQRFSITPNNEQSQRSPGDDYNGAQPKMINSSCRWLETCDRLGAVTPSTKTTEVLNIIRGWQNEAPKDKIVIFTEWIGTAIVIGRMLQRANIEFVYYCGQIPTKDRDKNLEDFKSKPDIKVMISTIAAGNVGLNITVANRMIIMNPWWNCAAEAQAFGRIKRHGQTKETYMIRLFAKGTIDERIHKLQEQKAREIKEAMNQGFKPKPLSQVERQWLMGNRDALESPFEESDDETVGDDDSDSSD